MTPEQIQSVLDGLHADAARCDADGERRAAGLIRGLMSRLQSYMPSSPVPAPQPPPVAVPEPETDTEPPEPAEAPTRRLRKPKGV